MIAADKSTLLIIDFQERLAPVIDGGAAAIAQAGKLARAAALLGVPTFYTEQNPRGLGPTVPELAPAPQQIVTKTAFDASCASGLLERIHQDHAVVLAGVETHICVLQTALGLLNAGRRVYVAADAVGSRKPESKALGLERMARHGAEIITIEMALFEWLGASTHPRFKEISALIK
ncbi:MAG: isochorismatase family protein [Hyphomicrobiales bacterium]|nr:isochorismatase family protein [Hyphomicrobiales bacterium]